MAKINVSNQLSVNAHLKPDTDDGFALGTTANKWADLFMASGAVLNFNEGDVTMTHASNLLTITGGNVRVDRLELDSASDYLDVSTDLQIVAGSSGANIVLNPAGNSVNPGGDSEDDLGERVSIVSSLSIASAQPTLEAASSILRLSSLGDAGDVASGDIVTVGSFVGFASGAGSSTASVFSSVTASSVALSSSSKAVRFSSVGALSAVVSGDTIKVGSFSAQATGAASATATVNTSFHSNISDSSLTSSSSAINFSGSLSSLLPDAQVGDKITLVSSGTTFTATIASLASSSIGISSVSFTSGSSISLSSVSSSTHTASGIPITSASGSDSGSGSASGEAIGIPLQGGSGLGSQTSPSSASTKKVERRLHWRKLFVDDIDLSGQGRLDLDVRSRVSLRSSASDQMDFEVGGSDIMALTDGSLVLKGSTPTITIGDGGAEDTALVYDGNSVDMYMGLDDTDDKLKLGLGSAVGTNPNMELNSADRDVKFFGDIEVAGGKITLTNGSLIDSETSGELQLTEDLVVITGDLKVEGNDIKASDGTTAITMSGADVTIAGDLTVSGDTTTLDVSNLLVEDQIIVINKGNSSANGQGGLAIEMGGSSTDMVFGRVADDTWGVGTKDTSGGTATTVADMTVTKFRASELEVEGTANKVYLDTDLKIKAAADLEIEANSIKPASNDGVALGEAALGFSDLFLADGAVIGYGDGGLTLTHTETQSLGSDLKSTHGPNLLSSQTFNTDLTSFAFIGLGSDIKSSHVGNITNSSLTPSSSSLTFDSSSNAAAFASAIGSPGTIVRFDDGSAIYDLQFGTYSSGSSISISSVVQVLESSSLSISGVTSSGSIKVVSTSNSDAQSAAAAFASAIGEGGIVRLDDNSSPNKIDYTLGAYSVGATEVSITKVKRIDGTGAIALSTIGSSSGGGSIKKNTPIDKIAHTDSFDLSEHDGASKGLHLAGVHMAAGAAELNAVADVSAGASHVGSVDVSADHFIFRDGGNTGASKIESFVDLAAAMAGNGLDASSGQFKISHMTDIASSASRNSILSADLATASLSAVPMALAATNITASVAVYVNGLLQTPSGSVETNQNFSAEGDDHQAAYDYEFVLDEEAGKSLVKLVNALDYDDVIQIKYFKA